MTMFGTDVNTPVGRGLGSYANPHFTIAMRDIPTQLKQIQRLCRFYYHTDSLLGAIVDKMAEYPITQILVEEKPDRPLSSEDRDRWENLINITMNLRQVMIDINVDKKVYGTSFHYLYYPFVRYCVTAEGERFPLSACAHVFRVMPEDSRSGFTFKVEVEHPRTKARVVCSVEDTKSESRSGFKLIRWSPLRVELRFNPTSGAREWQWTPPTRMRDGFINADRTILDSTEMRVLEAIYKQQKIRVNENRIWVAMAQSEPDLWEGWGVPPLFRVLEDVYYYKVLRRANEALAQEHVTPLRFLAPRGTGDVSPQRTLNLSDWQNRLKGELMKFKRDPNHIVVTPMPVEVEQMGGNARIMMVAAEMEAAARSVAAGLGCPIELIWGGLNWTGASVSLRVLENHFINMREDSERLLDFLAPKLASYFRMTPVKLKLAEFRMADDAQHQANAINLMLQGFLSRESVIGEMKYDANEEFERLEKEHERLNRITMKDNVAAAHMNSVIRALEAKADMLLQYELKLTQQNLDAQSERERLMQLQAHVADMHKKGYSTPLEFDQSAMLLQRMDPNLSRTVLQHWMQTMPNVTRLLMHRMGRQMEELQVQQQAMQAPGAANAGAAQYGNALPDPGAGPYAEGGVDPGAPLPNQRPPRREPAVI